MRFDAIVIGRAPGACHAALEASLHGLAVLLVCSEPVSSIGDGCGVGMHLLREAIVREQTTGRIVADASSQPPARALSLHRMQERQTEISAVQWTTLHRRITEVGVRVVESGALLASPTRVRLSNSEEHEAPIVIVATGSRPRRPARFAFDDHLICDHDSVFRRGALPRKLVVIGADDIGCEIACVYAALGVTVTAIDRRSRLFRFVDRDLLELLHVRMQGAGIEIVLQEELRDLEVRSDSGDPHAVLTLESGRREVADCVVVCGGRLPRTEGLGLEALGVETDPRGFVSVDEWFQTSVPGLYAVGDVIASPWRACGAGQGRYAVRHALKLSQETSPEGPLSIYSIPEIATVGITEEMCSYLDVHCAVGVARSWDTLWGQIRSERDGMLKLVVEQGSRKLIGVHAIGDGANDLIHIGALLVARGSTVDELTQGSFNPTGPAEAYSIAAQAALHRLVTQDGLAGAEPAPRP